MVSKKEWTRPASSGEGNIASYLWAPEQPTAILMIAHGMAEHSARYDAFANFMAQNGFAVCMNDHAGHGKSDGTRGYFAASNGWQHLLNDLKALLDEAKAMYPGLPLVLMGHSMGSFLARSYITRYGDELNACILSGTMGANPAIGFAKGLAALQARLFGPKKVGKFLDKVSTGNYHKRIAQPVNQFAWLSANDQNCIDYENDPNCGFVFTVSGYHDMFTGISEISAPTWAPAVPKNLPIFVLAGAEDPVGAWGEGPTQVADNLKAAGVKDVALTLYEGMRHEPLNEDDYQRVFDDILAWATAHLPTA